MREMGVEKDFLTTINTAWIYEFRRSRWWLRSKSTCCTGTIYTKNLSMTVTLVWQTETDGSWEQFSQSKQWASASEILCLKRIGCKVIVQDPDNLLWPLYMCTWAHSPCTRMYVIHTHSCTLRNAHTHMYEYICHTCMALWLGLSAHVQRSGQGPQRLFSKVKKKRQEQ